MAAVLLSLALFLPQTSCKRKDPEKCQQGMTVTRQALTGEDFALARQWRDYAYKNCDDATTLGALDQEIVNKEAEVQKKKAQQDQEKSENAAVLQLFSRWISESRAAPQNASKNFICDTLPENTPKEKQKDHWCNAVRHVDTRYTFSVRYWEAEPDAVRYSTRPPHPTTCADLGDGSVVARTWQVAAPGGQSVQRTLCNITAGPLAGMQAVTTAAIADVLVFTPKYAQRDPRVVQ